jgi:PleD family two-component response regulator
MKKDFLGCFLYNYCSIFEGQRMPLIVVTYSAYILKGFYMSPIHVMVIDDSSDDLMLFQRAVNKDDTVKEIKLTEVRSSESALKKLKSPSRPPDLIFLDLHLADISGVKLLKILKGSGRTMHIPVIVTTGNEGSVSIIEAMSEGASSYIFKDYDLEEYFSTLRAIIVYWVDYHQLPTNTGVIPI